MQINVAEDNLVIDASDWTKSESASGLLMNCVYFIRIIIHAKSSASQKRAAEFLW